MATFTRRPQIRVGYYPGETAPPVLTRNALGVAEVADRPNPNAAIELFKAHTPATARVGGSFGALPFGSLQPPQRADLFGLQERARQQRQASIARFQAEHGGRLPEEAYRQGAAGQWDALMQALFEAGAEDVGFGGANALVERARPMSTLEVENLPAGFTRGGFERSVERAVRTDQLPSYYYGALPSTRAEFGRRLPGQYRALERELEQQSPVNLDAGEELERRARFFRQFGRVPARGTF